MGNVQVVEALLSDDTVDVNVQRADGKQPFITIAMGNVQVVKALLANDKVDSESPKYY
jgi:hypothetical protein